MSKKIVSLALIMCLALLPMTALAESKCEKIENTYATATPIFAGEKVEVGKKQEGTSKNGDFIYYNCNIKYTFTLTATSEVVFELSTDTPPTDYKTQFLEMRLYNEDGATELYPFDGDYITVVRSDEAILSKRVACKLNPGKYYVVVRCENSNNSYGWLEYKSSVTHEDDFGGEPNDTMALAYEKPTVGTGAEYVGNIAYEGKKDGTKFTKDNYDYYRFDIPVEGYGVKLTAARADIGGNRLEVFLHDDGTRRVGDIIDLSVKTTGSVELKNLAKGTYYVLINAWFSPARPTEYTFRLDPLDGSTAVTPPVTTTPPITTTPPKVSGLTATPTASTVLVNGKNVAFDAYEINGNNYFKLRDLAFILNGTEKQFAIGWDGANNAISLTSGQPYTAVGGEMEGKGSGAKTPNPTDSKILLDGKEVSFTAYTIDGNNYLKLRDIGTAFNFGVDWDEAKNTIVIDTSKGYGQ